MGTVADAIPLQPATIRRGYEQGPSPHGITRRIGEWIAREKAGRSLLLAVEVAVLGCFCMQPALGAEPVAPVRWPFVGYNVPQGHFMVAGHRKPGLAAEDGGVEEGLEKPAASSLIPPDVQISRIRLSRILSP
jgi:hypothetical protein